MLVGMMVIHVGDGTWAGVGQGFLEAQEKMRKMLKIRKEEYDSFYLLGRQATTLEDGTITVDSAKYMSTLQPVHVPAQRRRQATSSLEGKEITQYRSLVQQVAWPARTGLPSIAYDVSDLQQRISEATVADLAHANFV